MGANGSGPATYTSATAEIQNPSNPVDNNLAATAYAEQVDGNSRIIVKDVKIAWGIGV